MSEDFTDPEIIAAVLLNMSATSQVLEERKNELSFSEAQVEENNEEESEYEEEEIVSQPHNNSSNPKKRQTVYKVKKNRSTLVAICFPPGDVRNSYAESLFEATNSGDISFISKIINSICTTDVKLICKFKIPDNTIIPEDIEVNGIPALCAATAATVLTTPDAIVQMLSKQVEVYRNGESVITATWTMKGTKMYGMIGVEGSSKDKVFITAAPSNSTSSSSASPNSTDGLITSISSLDINASVKRKIVDPQSKKIVEVEDSTKFGLSERLDTSLKLDWEGTNTYYINKMKKVYLIVSEK